jgi:ribonuclease HI
MTSVPKSSPPHGQRLFGEPERQTAHVAYIDGASRGNPGPAAYAVVLQGPGGQTLAEIGKYFGRATNNVAEYYGLIAALDAAQSRGVTRLLIRSDSELLVRQMQGRYKVKSADLKPLYERALKLSRGFAHFAIEHVPREQNTEADALGNRALDETSRSSASRSDAAPLIAAIATPAPAAKFDAAPNRTASAPAAAAAGKTTIRARYSAGALHPLGALDLDEGEIVEITIKKSGRD